jgi:hypothetical protein
VRLYPFWQPFSARSAALGFATRVQAVSGVPVEIVESLGGYQAAVRYRDEAALREVLAAIHRATGLRLESMEAGHASR